MLEAGGEVRRGKLSGYGDFNARDSTHAKYPVGYGEFKPQRDIAVPHIYPGEDVPEGDCAPRHHPGRVRRNHRRIGPKSTEKGAKREENQVRDGSRQSLAKSPENYQTSARN